MGRAQMRSRRYTRIAPLVCLLAVVGLAGCGVTKSTAWAPDGAQLAVAYGGQLYLVAADGSGVGRVSRSSVILDGPGESAVSWSPDGREIAFARGSEIWIAEVGTGAERRLATGANPAWSPGGRWVAHTIWHDGGTAASTEVWITDPATPTATRLLGTIAGSNDVTVDWSPNGQRLAAGGENALVIFGVDDGSRQVLTGGIFATPDWSPDGSQLVFATQGGLVIASLDGASRTPLTTNQADAVDSEPAWSPDGRRVAFIREKE
jgi:Tol biopolymer transport system component